MTTPINLLIVDDSTADTALIVETLERNGYTPRHERVASPEALRAALERQPWDLVVGECSMPHFSWLSALQLVNDVRPGLPFLAISAVLCEDLAVRALRAGARDYIVKRNLPRLVPAVQRELREAARCRDHARTDQAVPSRVSSLAAIDAVTGLPNRSGLYARLQALMELAGGERRVMALLLLNLDDFKEISNTLGRQRADLLLSQVASRLKSVLWAPDIVSYLGSDEFAVLLPRLSTTTDIGVVIRKLQTVFEAPFMIEGLPLASEASIGVALYPDHGRTPDLLLQRADVALSAAKRTGRCVTYDVQSDRYSPRRLALLGQLRAAIDQNQLRLHFQPLIDVATRRTMGFEALARWQHPSFGLLTPDQFIVPAEQTGLILPLTYWVLNAALRECAAWRRHGRPFTVAVNLSARTLYDPTLTDQTAALLKGYDLPPGALMLEITESAIIADPARARATLMRLREVGVRLAIDDFGTGYSSLAYLKDLPVHEIKIDRSFIKDITEHANGVSIVQAVITLGHSLNLRVVAEGVENTTVWDLLAGLGCDAAQGYYISRPLPGESLSDWLSASGWG